MTLLLAGAHLPYPRTDGFHAEGERLVLTRYAPATGATGLVGIRWRGEERAARTLYEASLSTTGPEQMLWPDVSLASERAAWARNGALHVLDLDSGTPERLYTPAPGHTLQDLCSLTASGDRVVVKGTPRGPGGAGDLSGGLGVHREGRRAVRQGLVRQPPGSQPARRGLADLRPRRARPGGPGPDLGPAPHTGTGGSLRLRRATERGTLAVGHERWMFHDLGAVVCAYGEREAGPRGLYAVHPDGRSPRLVSEGARGRHCGIRDSPQPLGLPDV
ncbi:hypothetical protein [Streptomyces sp. NPDC002403]